MSKAANVLISGWRSCGEEGMVVWIPSCVVVTGGGEGVRIFQVWVGVTVRSLSLSQLFQFSKKLLEVSLLGRGGEYFKGHGNDINVRTG